MAFDVLLRVFGTFGLLIALPIHTRVRKHLSQTTLMTAWHWATLTWSFWATAWCVDVLTASIDERLSDQLWYFIAILLGGSFIAVLGARRPTARAWPWFILLPLLIVLGWPALAVWGRDLRPGVLEIETPTVLGFVLVLVMGTGNYLGTRFTGPALLAGGSAMMLVVPYWSRLSGDLAESRTMRSWATAVYVIAALLAWWKVRKPSVRDEEGLQRMWLDFRDAFGIVWAKRALERVNEALQRENCPARLELHGLVWTESDPDDDRRKKSEEVFEQRLRWLLQRFVDPEWIDERLKSRQTNDEPVQRQSLP